jgi:Fe(3+) dicitrate transport protein
MRPGYEETRAGARSDTGRRPRAGHLCKAIAVALAVLPLALPCRAADAEATDTIRLEEEQVVGERATEAPPFLSDVEGTSIYAGKKTTVVDPQTPPKIVNDNYRQALSRVPGLYLSEETTPLVSIGYRGLDPHRSQFTMVLKDGVPIAADLFGYPENYYLPPLDSIEEIEFVHGGASLLYGPQIGGALNYITRKPNPNRPASLYTNQSWGSDQYYSTYNEVSGTLDRFGYLGYYYQKQGNGFRDSNSDFDLYSGSLKLTYQLNDTNRLLVAFDGYNENHGEPGGLAAQPGASNAVLYSDDRDATTRLFDRFSLDRYVGWGIWESDIGSDTLLRVTSWGGHYTRLSWRQRGGGFGTLPSGDAANTNTIENQQFNTFGLDGRVRHNWTAFDQTHTFTTGAIYYHGNSPRSDKRGSTPDATDGTLRNKSERLTNYGAVFAENRFTYGNFALIPALRLENFSESINEKVNLDKTDRDMPVPLAEDSTYDFVPLFGVGAAYTFWPTVDAYANVSRSYRPQVFTQAVSLSPTQSIAGDLEPTSSYQYEIGFRGNPRPWVYWDTSLFWLEIDDQIGSTQLPDGTSQIANVGAARHLGWELAAEVGTLSLLDHFTGNTLATRLGDLSLFGNVMLLDAEFTDGPNEGKTPQYAADYLVRAGLQYVYPHIAKISLLSTAVANAYANDNNTADFFVPHYNVWDLTMEARVYRELVALHFGVNNLFNENYFARVRSDGIDPAYRRNFYGGFKVNL